MENKPQSERAHELAEFVRGFCKEPRPLYFLDWLSERYDVQDELSNVVYDKFADEIESLAKPDGLPYPLDKDGIPIKPGDTVYYKCRYDEDFIVEKIIIAENESSKKELSIEIVGVSEDKNRGYSVSPNEVTHNKSRTLNDIIREMRNAFYEDELRISLVQEAYELGKKEAYEIGRRDGANDAKA